MDIYNSIIMEHFRDPVNFNNNIKGIYYENTSCGDSITVNLDINSDQTVSMTYFSKGCALSVASASILSKIITGMDLVSATDLVRRFSENSKDGDFSDYSELEALQSMNAYSSRINCIKLPWHAVLSEINEKYYKNK